MKGTALFLLWRGKDAGSIPLIQCVHLHASQSLYLFPQSPLHSNRGAGIQPRGGGGQAAGVHGGGKALGLHAVFKKRSGRGQCGDFVTGEKWRTVAEIPSAVCSPPCSHLVSVGFRQAGVLIQSRCTWPVCSASCKKVPVLVEKHTQKGSTVVSLSRSTWEVQKGAQRGIYRDDPSSFGSGNESAGGSA